MPLPARRPAAALVMALTSVVTAVFVATGSAAAAIATTTSTTASSTSSSGAPSECTNKQAPPPAEDDSEQPAPGTAAPGPLPVPADPVGGDQLGKCGFVLPPDESAPPPPAEVTAASWVVADLDTGAVLAAKSPHARQRPASLIKVLLAMVALDDLKPSTPVLITQEDVDAAKGFSAIGVPAGGKYTVTQLVEAMLLKPGNDVPHALARALGGVPKTLDLMNALAKQMGALDTRVATPGGLDGPGMSTSAYDLAVIYRHAMQMPAFAEAAGVKSVTLGGVSVHNSDSLLTSYAGAITGITSNTTDAHWTNLSAAAKDGHRLVTVLLRGEQDDFPMYRQSSKLLDYGFTLTAANTHAVGALVDQAPPVKPSVASTSTQTTTETSDANSVQTAADQSLMYEAFGNVGMPLTALAVLVVLAALVMYLRKRRARAARARRLAAQNN